MPVDAEDFDATAAEYAPTLERIAGCPSTLDLIHLGLGSDGHTASLVLGDPILASIKADVGVPSVYEGQRRMTLTYLTLNRARQILWVVTGEHKADMLLRLYQGDTTIPADRVRADQAVVFADRHDARYLSSRMERGCLY